MPLPRMFRKSVVFHLLMFVVFLVSGTISSVLALFVYVFVRPINIQLSRKINWHLCYSVWINFTFMGQWWSNTDCSINCTEDTVPHLGKESCVVIMNHKYDIDWIIIWILTERVGLLGNTKLYAKDTLKYVPFIGWLWLMTENIFLKRNMEKDRETMNRQLANLSQYPEDYPVALLIFPEGTRFTEVKHQASLQVSRSKGYPEMKHVLLPRIKGFLTAIRGLKGKFPTVYDTTIAFQKDGPEPTFMNIMNGEDFNASMHVRRIPLDDIPDTEQECGDWLRKLFKEKDHLYDEFLEKGHFPDKNFILPKRISDLVMYLFWLGLTLALLAYMLFYLVSYGGLYQHIAVVSLCILGPFFLKRLVDVTDTTKGSSYGKT